jgi:6-phosphogluconolactonase (cycloisomerase 2 family)
VSLDYSGTVMLIGGTTPDAVFKYNLSTPWQVNTATYSQTYNTAGQETSVSDVFVRPDGMSLFFSGTSSDRVWGYRVNNTSLSVGGQETNPTGVFFKPDGTKMYITGTTGDDVTQYTLSTPWDLGSKSHDGQSSVSSYETTPNGVYISPDGAYLFISGDIGNDVNRFAISTPWDVTSGLSYQQAFSVAGQASNVRDLWFKPDGTKMYIAENSNNVIQYSLTTPWSLTTASLEKEQTVTSSEASSIAGIAFSEDGTKLFCTDDTNNNTRDIVSFVLSTPWDIATLTYEGRIPSYDFAPKGLYLSPDGEHLAMVDQLYDRVKPFKFEA